MLVWEASYSQGSDPSLWIQSPVWTLVSEQPDTRGSRNKLPKNAALVTVALTACMFSIDSTVRMRALAVLGVVLLVAWTHGFFTFLWTREDLFWGE